MPSPYDQLATAVREAAKGVIEYETDNPFVLVRFLRLKALGEGTVEIGEKVPATQERMGEASSVASDATIGEVLMSDAEPTRERIQLGARKAVKITRGERPQNVFDNRDEWEKRKAKP